jgi:Cysteine-rich secretory protein family
MSSTLRLCTILVALLFLALLLTETMHAAARPDVGSAESILLDAANRDRAAAGISPLQWDAALASAARNHAIRMAQRNTLSHQLPGELALQDRATQSGARFSLIAENIAEGPSVIGLHSQWMNSAPHRANLLDPELNTIGISVVQGGNFLFAVEDFSTVVASLTLDAQELQVSSLLAARGLHLANAISDARKTCDLDRGWSGQRPVIVLRYETSDLSRLPADIDQKVQGGKYRAAAVGACEAGSATGFARFRIAILLY